MRLYFKPAWPGWVKDFILQIERSARQYPDFPVPLATFTVAGVPPAADHPRTLIYVSNEIGGATVAFSDGTNWRRVQDRAIIA